MCARSQQETQLVQPAKFSDVQLSINLTGERLVHMLYGPKNMEAWASFFDICAQFRIARGAMYERCIPFSLLHPWLVRKKRGDSEEVHNTIVLENLVRRSGSLWRTAAAAQAQQVVAALELETAEAWEKRLLQLRHRCLMDRWAATWKPGADINLKAIRKPRTGVDSQLRPRSRSESDRWQETRNWRGTGWPRRQTQELETSANSDSGRVSGRCQPICWIVECPWHRAAVRIRSWAAVSRSTWAVERHNVAGAMLSFGGLHSRWLQGRIRQGTGWFHASWLVNWLVASSLGHVWL